MTNEPDTFLSRRVRPRVIASALLVIAGIVAVASFGVFANSTRGEISFPVLFLLSALAVTGAFHGIHYFRSSRDSAVVHQEIFHRVFWLQIGLICLIVLVILKPLFIMLRIAFGLVEHGSTGEIAVAIAIVMGMISIGVVPCWASLRILSQPFRISIVGEFAELWSLYARKRFVLNQSDVIVVCDQTGKHKGLILSSDQNEYAVRIPAHSNITNHMCSLVRQCEKIRTVIPAELFPSLILVVVYSFTAVLLLCLPTLLFQVGVFWVTFARQLPMSLSMQLMAIPLGMVIGTVLCTSPVFGAVMKLLSCDWSAPAKNQFSILVADRYTPVVIMDEHIPARLAMTEGALQIKTRSWNLSIPVASVRAIEMPTRPNLITCLRTSLPVKSARGIELDWLGSDGVRSCIEIVSRGGKLPSSDKRAEEPLLATLSDWRDGHTAVLPRQTKVTAFRILTAACITAAIVILPMHGWLYDELVLKGRWIPQTSLPTVDEVFAYPTRPMITGEILATETAQSKDYGTVRFRLLAVDLLTSRARTLVPGTMDYVPATPFPVSHVLDESNMNDLYYGSMLPLMRHVSRPRLIDLTTLRARSLSSVPWRNMTLPQLALYRDEKIFFAERKLYSPTGSTDSRQGYDCGIMDLKTEQVRLLGSVTTDDQSAAPAPPVFWDADHVQIADRILNINTGHVTPRPPLILH